MPSPICSYCYKAYLNVTLISLSALAQLLRYFAQFHFSNYEFLWVLHPFKPYWLSLCLTACNEIYTVAPELNSPARFEDYLLRFVSETCFNLLSSSCVTFRFSFRLWLPILKRSSQQNVLKLFQLIYKNILLFLLLLLGFALRCLNVHLYIFLTWHFNDTKPNMLANLN